MENPILDAKNEIMKWVGNLDDLDIIQQLLELKNENNSPSQVFESSAEYAVKDDFDEKFAKGMGSENSRKESKKRVREWWGK
ncbi:hypothetical protein [Halpernia sp. GG3]